MPSASDPATSTWNGQPATAVAPGRPAPSPPRLGEELPIFCERCGYNLNGLPQARCERCAILQFHCPECGHHQPINTLRPAAQRVLGRIRAFVLGAFVFFKLNFFFWLLFAWTGIGVDTSYRYNHEAVRTVTVNGKPVRQQHGPAMVPRPINLERIVGFCALGTVFGMIGRMLVLRWRRGWCVGLVMAALVMAALSLGAHLSRMGEDDPRIASPYTPDFLLLLALSGAVVLTAATFVFPLWVMLVHVFLPRAWAKALLDWQTFHTRRADALASA